MSFKAFLPLVCGLPNLTLAHLRLILLSVALILHLTTLSRGITMSNSEEDVGKADTIILSDEASDEDEISQSAKATVGPREFGAGGKLILVPREAEDG